MKSIGDKYMISDCLLGKGQYGEVYKGKNKKTEEDVAIKKVWVHKLTENAARRLGDEIKILKDLSHPNIIEQYDHIKTRNNTYIITEYCSGGDLSSFVSNYGCVSETLLREWAVQLLSVFILMKDNNVMHRDIKLANILVSYTSTVPQLKVADFGFSKVLSESGVATTLLGTPMYMAPEIFRMEPYSYKADVWSLGVVFYYLLVGSFPFKRTSHDAIKNGQIQNIQFPDTISEPVKDFIRRMLIQDINERPNFEDLVGHPFLSDNLEPVDQQNPRHSFDNQLNEIECYLGILLNIFNKRDYFTAIGVVLYLHKISASNVATINSNYTIYLSSALYRAKDLNVRIRRVLGAIQMRLLLYHEVVSDGKVTELFRDEIIELLKLEVTTCKPFDYLVLKKNVLILNALLDLNPLDQWAIYHLENYSKLLAEKTL